MISDTGDTRRKVADSMAFVFRPTALKPKQNDKENHRLSDANS